MYSTKRKSAILFLDEITKQNKETLENDATHMIDNAKRLIDIQCGIASHFMSWWNAEGMPPMREENRALSPILLSGFHKNIINFYAALELTTLGLYGPSFPLIRNIYEWLMVCKFSSLSGNTHIVDKWHKQETIYFSNSILKKIIIPDSRPFAEFWSIVCGTSHATRTSGQISIKVDYIREDILANLAILNALLECNYHLLNTHLISSEYEYMAKFYCTRYQIAEYKIPDLRKEAHKVFRENRNFLSKDSIELITAYKRKWSIKQ